jgi:hypothetical protein
MLDANGAAIPNTQVVDIVIDYIPVAADQANHPANQAHEHEQEQEQEQEQNPTGQNHDQAEQNPTENNQSSMWSNNVRDMILSRMRFGNPSVNNPPLSENTRPAISLISSASTNTSTNRSTNTSMFMNILRQLDEIPGLEFTIERTHVNNPPLEQEQRGMTAQQISECTSPIIFHGTVGDEPMTCPISMEDFVEGEEILEINACSHMFKKSHLARWFAQHSTCPVCRRQLRPVTDNDDSGTSSGFTMEMSEDGDTGERRWYV